MHLEKQAYDQVFDARDLINTIRKDLRSGFVILLSIIFGRRGLRLGHRCESYNHNWIIGGLKSRQASMCGIQSCLVEED